MNSIQDELRKDCHVCKGSGYTLAEKDMGLTTVTRKCKACEGTGKSKEWQELERDFASIFTCAKCGAHKVHYRLHGYRCPHGCESGS